MEHTTTRKNVSRRLDIAIRWIGCFGFFKLVQSLTLFVTFPIGGGAFHAMFAYSEVGRPNVAMHVFWLMVLSCLISNSLLQFFSVGVRWWWLALLGALAASHAWLEVTTWSPVSAEFQTFVERLAWALPPTCLLVAFAVRQVVRRVDAIDG